MRRHLRPALGRVALARLEPGQVQSMVTDSRRSTPWRWRWVFDRARSSACAGWTSISTPALSPCPRRCSASAASSPSWSRSHAAADGASRQREGAAADWCPGGSPSRRELAGRGPAPWRRCSALARGRRSLWRLRRHLARLSIAARCGSLTLGETTSHPREALAFLKADGTIRGHRRAGTAQPRVGPISGRSLQGSTEARRSSGV